MCSRSPLFRLIIVTQSYLVRVCFFNSWTSLQKLRLLKKLKFRIGRKHLSKLHVVFIRPTLEYAWLLCLWYWKVWKRTVLCSLNCYWSSILHLENPLIQKLFGKLYAAKNDYSVQWLCPTLLNQTWKCIHVHNTRNKNNYFIPRSR